MSEVTLEPFEWVEIDQDFCTHSYGVAPCSAGLESGGTECFNTRKSCQDPENYDRGTLTLRFCKSQSFLPDDGYYLPSLVSVNLSAGSINPVGAGGNSSALGTRGGITVEFADHPHTDKYVDPYLADRMSRDSGYIATERGTFWTKWRARNQYYVGRQIRHCTGFIRDGVVTDVVTRTYFITGFDGPDASGAVVIQGKDLLSQLTNEKVKAPFASKGKLLSDISDSDTSWPLDPIGVGAEYPASGLVRLGSELCTFTRVGDVLTVVRARHTTKASSANAGTVVQLCLEYSAQAPMAILEDLLVNYAGIPTAYLDLAQWAQEQTDYMPRLYSAIITEPTGILDLISEMATQMYFYTVWDERSSKLKVRAIRPAIDDTVHELDDFANLLVDSIQLRDLPEQLITQAWVYYGIINPAASATDPKNYAAREILLTDEGSADKHGADKIKQIFCRWIDEGGAAIDLGEKMIARYGAAPRQATFSLAAKNSDIWLGDFVRLNHRLSVDMTGAPLPMNMQVMSAQQSRAGVLFNYVCQEFVYEKPIDPTQDSLVISFDQNNLNLRDYYDNHRSVPPASGDTVTFLIRSGVVIGGRGAADLELYAGESMYIERRADGANFNQVLARQLYPVMRRDATGRTFVPRGTVSPIFAPNYEQQSDMWIVPCSVAFDTGLWPVGVVINIIQEAGSYVVGEQGYSSIHAELFKPPGFAPAEGDCILHASDGGHALRIRHPVNWTNNGTIGGGGGGGLPALCNVKIMNPFFGASYHFSTYPSASGAGFALQGALPTLLGREGVETPRRDASGGSASSAGSGAIVDRKLAYPNARALRLTAGQAGGLAQSSGFPSTEDLGGNPSHAIVTYLTDYEGGLAGNAIIEGASLITWINKGDVRGAEVA